MKLQSFEAAQSYGLAKSALSPQKSLGPDAKPAGPAFEALHALAGAIDKGEKASIRYMTGGADPHSVVEAMAAAELAIETAVTIRDRVVEAYQELLRMPV
jgi:flagellar hook-basal body complex protein FliE